MEQIRHDRNRLSSDTYQRLVEAMVDGTLAPGDRLVQDQLAERLDVSRTPVRDALMRLHSEGVIVPTGRRGYVVRDLTPNEVRDGYEARMAVESFAAMRVATLGEPAVAQVRAALEHAAAEDLSTPQRSFRANRTFHRAVVRATGNDLLLFCFESIWGGALAMLTYRDYYAAQAVDEFVRSHAPLVDTLAEGDAERARLAAIAHIEDAIAHTPTSAAFPHAG
jgi:DNA-binding GntR family transcriptional regulator